jgi:flavorubredoxin
MARVDEICDGIYKICSPVKLPNGADFQFSQFLIDDERPALIHTGMHNTYDEVREAVAEVLDPAKLEYIALLHFEADECGGMYGFLEGSPGSKLACSFMSTITGFGGWNYEGPVEGHMEGDVIDLGEKKLRFLETPHVHHWDSMMLYEETTKSLFPSDLFIQPGDQPPVLTENLSDLMCEYYRQIGIFAHEKPVRDVVDRIEALDPEWVHGMHGGTIRKEDLPTYISALREQDFGYQGSLLGRPVLGPG